MKISADIVKEFSHRPPVDLDELAKALGVTVIYSDDFPNNINGALVKYNSGKYKIFINRFLQWYVQRFTLAHEIAHYVFHRGWVRVGDGIYDDTSFKSRLSEDREREANSYAIEILMPAALVKEKWDRLVLERGDEKEVKTFEIAEYFDVQVAAMASRLDELGIKKFDLASPEW